MEFKEATTVHLQFMQRTYLPTNRSRQGIMTKCSTLTHSPPTHTLKKKKKRKWNLPTQKWPGCGPQPRLPDLFREARIHWFPTLFLVSWVRVPLIIVSSVHSLSHAYHNHPLYPVSSIFPQLPYPGTFKLAHPGFLFTKWQTLTDFQSVQLSTRKAAAEDLERGVSTAKQISHGCHWSNISFLIY